MVATCHGIPNLHTSDLRRCLLLPRPPAVPVSASSNFELGAGARHLFGAHQAVEVFGAQQLQCDRGFFQR